MASPSELSLEEIRKYLLDHGGSARNQDLVKHFKKFLTDPETRVEARNRFKEYINTLATIKTEEGEKFLVLRKKFRQPTLDLSSPTLSFSSGFAASPISTPDISTPTTPLREPPPYRPPPMAPLTGSPMSPLSPVSPTSPLHSISPISPLSPIGNTSSPIHRFTQEPSMGLPLGIPTVESNITVQPAAVQESMIVSPARLPETASQTNSPVTSPPVPPRRKSQDKIKLNANKENQNIEKGRNGSESIKEDEGPSTTAAASNQLTPAEQLSVRERMQRFNRMATETDLPARPSASTPPIKKRSEKGTEEDDRASVASQLDGKSREWLVKAAQGDYQALAKLAAEDPRLARIKDPSSTALHWGAKHGDENIVKLIAGTCKDYIKSVNETSNGGYTALHIALQFDHENIFNLLVQVYGANQDIRDYSGKKARQYSISQKAAVSQDTMRKIKARKKHAEKDLGFLRIGSLNVRVKRTTEAFSQFLGVTTNTSSNNSEKIHKSWGSADNLPANKLMPPPKTAPIKKRRSRRATDFISGRSSTSVSQPSTPTPTGKTATSRRPASVSSLATSSPLKEHQLERQQNDSDSDGACGFDSAWRGSA